MIVILKSASFKCRQAGPGSEGRMPYLVARRRACELVGSSAGSCSANSDTLEKLLSISILQILSLSVRLLSL